MKYTDEQMFNTLVSFLAQDGTSSTGAIAVTPDTDIVGEGLVDSLGIFKLVAFVEETFKVTIEPEEVLLENFQTPRALQKLIMMKLDGEGERQLAP
jgi:acyl carrier protein